MVGSSGVDLAREERLKKCDKVIEFYEKIPTSQSIQSLMKRSSNDDVKYFFNFLF